MDNAAERDGPQMDGSCFFQALLLLQRYSNPVFDLILISAGDDDVFRLIRVHHWREPIQSLDIQVSNLSGWLG